MIQFRKTNKQTKYKSVF